LTEIGLYKTGGVLHGYAKEVLDGTVSEGLFQDGYLEDASEITKYDKVSFRDHKVDFRKYCLKAIEL